MEHIGVRGLLHGFLPIKLKECHVLFVTNHQNYKVKNNWVELIIKKLITMLHSLWKFRCLIVHKNDEKEAIIQYKQEVWEMVIFHIKKVIESKVQQKKLLMNYIMNLLSIGAVG